MTARQPLLADAGQLLTSRGFVIDYTVVHNMAYAYFRGLTLVVSSQVDFSGYTDVSGCVIKFGGEPDGTPELSLYDNIDYFDNLIFTKVSDDTIGDWVPHIPGGSPGALILYTADTYQLYLSFEFRFADIGADPQFFLLSRTRFSASAYPRAASW